MSGADRELFIRKVDKSKIPTCKVLGVDIAAINMNWLLKFTEKNIEKLKGDYMTVVNVYSCVSSYEDSEYCRIQNNAVLAMPDGGPLSTVGRKRGYKKMERTTGPSYMEEILKMSVEKGWSHFFYGSTPETLEKMRRKLLDTYPGLNIAGMYSPPFRPLTEEEDRLIVERINDLQPDFIWVGLGAPKQENWMATHQGRVNGVMIGVGAAFDYVAGNIKRAPEWMQKHNLEWVYRLIQEPKRLFMKYWHTNIRFIWLAMVRGK